LVNELALMSQRLGIDVWEVIDAAATKPFGFMPFYPGPGLGGHCIPIDPFYLSWKAKQSGFEARFIELAGQVNSNMPYAVVNLVGDALNDRKKSIRGSRVLVLGVAYKKDISDTRESPALDVIELLHARGAEVSYTDPLVPELELPDKKLLKSMPLSAETLRHVDCAVIVADHSTFDYALVARESPTVVDTRNALKEFKGEHIRRL
jgi:UDP-N-acetyl-D-glucosamine dehydrogenase